jgi:hypothetical protein
MPTNQWQTWLTMAALVVFAVIVIWAGPCIGLEAEATGALAGALMGGAGVLLAGMLDRAARRTDDHAAEQSKIAKLKALVAAELVNVASGALEAHRSVAGMVRGLAAGASPGGVDLSLYAPRMMPVSAALGSELLMLGEREIDVLTTLWGNLQLTRDDIRQLSARPLSQMDATTLSNQIAHDMGILAQAFEEFAPKRQLQMPGQEPALASTLLRSEAARR